MKKYAKIDRQVLGLEMTSKFPEESNRSKGAQIGVLVGKPFPKGFTPLFIRITPKK